VTHLKSMLKWELTLQSRNRIIHVALASVILYFVVLNALPRLNTDDVLTMLLFMDPALVGITFIGVLVLFEKTENTLQALNITPMEPREYLLTKIISLTLISIAAALIFTLLIYVGFGVGFNVLLLLAGITLTSVFLILLGFLLVSRYSSINEYLVVMGGAMVVLILPPMLYLSGLFENALFYVFPTQASFILLLGVFGEVEPWEVLYSVAYLLFWIVVCYVLAKRAYYTHIVMGGD